MPKELSEGQRHRQGSSPKPVAKYQQVWKVMPSPNPVTARMQLEIEAMTRGTAAGMASPLQSSHMVREKAGSEGGGDFSGKCGREKERRKSRWRNQRIGHREKIQQEKLHLLQLEHGESDRRSCVGGRYRLCESVCSKIQRCNF